MTETNMHCCLKTKTKSKIAATINTGGVRVFSGVSSKCELGVLGCWGSGTGVSSKCVLSVLGC